MKNSQKEFQMISLGLFLLFKSDMSNILLNGCEIENGTVQTDSGDVFFKNCDFDNLKVQTDMGDINVDDALTGKRMEDQDDCDISYTRKGTGGNLVIQTNSGDVRLKCRASDS